MALNIGQTEDIGAIVVGNHVIGVVGELFRCECRGGRLCLLKFVYLSVAHALIKRNAMDW